MKGRKVSASSKKKDYKLKRRCLHIAIRLAPIIIRFKRDRKEWVKKEGKGCDEARMRRNASKAVKTFIDLGPVFIKFGQWLSSRPDLLPQPYLEEFAKLQDDVPPAPIEEVKRIIEEEFGAMDKAFDSFNERCISGASLGQVYMATYKGRDVVVKVIRPNIHYTVERDLEAIRLLLPYAIRFLDPNIAFSLESIYYQFVETIREEMDYRIEAENLRRIKRNLRGDRYVMIPDVIEERSSSRVLTLEYIPGVKVTDVERLDALGIDRRTLVIRLHRLFFKMLLKHDIFHADPHPGNIAVKEDGTIILYDFGMVGRLDTSTRLKLIRLYLALIEKDPARAVNILFSLGALAPDANRYVIEKGIALAIEGMHGKKVDEMEVKALMELANRTMTRFPFRLPKQLALYMRMASLLEGIYLTLKVDFQFMRVLSSLLQEEGLIRDAYIEEVKSSIESIVRGLQDYIAVAPMLRDYLERSLMEGSSSSSSRSGRLGYRTRLSSSATLIAGSIVTSSLLISSAIIMESNPTLGQIGFAAAAMAIGVMLIARKI
ncbi:MULTISPECIES: ABC1 kinase family protein [Candidatus Nitrosocaldus]|jgi:predicted unusual protein kinase regulating ubiquinone biosynthesis (AarF/ABC1/UbiB family)|uniref:ABC-1 domain-containing protein n=1 Tax=Candidatus Nitrosocaldus cavascurensis TaxID=2058097 RepID=A0A2K5ANJ2_9ARCH|nr:MULTISPECIES: AarF/ABC1/UbiB kinase family protein [Candidatus Nitrosocaldus]SPC33211.1 ABC-1 domain-containing protein [Candidatus Nitrosocaldus cavascurensis]